MKLVFLPILVFSALLGYAQNTFPASGNVGLGNTAPKALLDVDGTTLLSGGGANIDASFTTMPMPVNSGKMLVGFNYTGGGGETDFIGDRIDGLTGGFRFYSRPSSGILKNILSMSGDGFVGIGVANPSILLHVAGPEDNSVSAIVGGATFYSATNTRPAGVKTLRNVMSLYANGTNGEAWSQKWNFKMGSNAFHPDGQRNTNQLTITTSSGGDSNHIAESDIFTLTGTGRVGIGTTNPQADIDNGGFKQDGATRTVLARMGEGNAVGDGTYLGVKAFETGFGGYGGKGFSIENHFYGNKNSAINFYRGSGTTGGCMTFETNNGNECMRLTNYGTVLIGKTNQANGLYKLDVDGVIRANKLVVNTTGADFVFKPSYQLIPLSEVEKFVKLNQHLPGVATAATMQKDGVEVGEYQTKLLQKIEELTLYAIAQEKQLETQKKIQQEQMKTMEDKLQIVLKKLEAMEKK